MSGTHPHFRASYTHEELVESFLFTPADLELVFGCRTDVKLIHGKTTQTVGHC